MSVYCKCFCNNLTPHIRNDRFEFKKNKHLICERAVKDRNTSNLKFLENSIPDHESLLGFKICQFIRLLLSTDLAIHFLERNIRARKFSNIKVVGNVIRYSRKTLSQNQNATNWIDARTQNIHRVHCEENFPTFHEKFRSRA